MCTVVTITRLRVRVDKQAYNTQALGWFCATGEEPLTGCAKSVMSRGVKIVVSQECDEPLSCCRPVTGADFSTAYAGCA
jgi:hypothetical protein